MAFIRWRHKHAEEAEAAMGRAITIARAEIGTTPSPNSKDPVFSTEQERAATRHRRVSEGRCQVRRSLPHPGKYFIARNQLVTERDKGLAELQSLSSGRGEVAVLSKFVLAQAKEADGKYDEAAALYGEIAKLGSPVVTPDTANLRLAAVYEKQGKKKEAADSSSI